MEGVIRDEASVHAVAHDPARRAFELLHWGFVAIPAVAGFDKFTHLLTNWDRYLAPVVQRALPFSAHAFMLFVGAVELVAAMLVAIRPRIGAYVVTGWLAAIVLNLILCRAYYDVALRDVGLAVAAIALGWLSSRYDVVERPPATRVVR